MWSLSVTQPHCPWESLPETVDLYLLPILWPATALLNQGKKGKMPPRKNMPHAGVKLAVVFAFDMEMLSTEPLFACQCQATIWVGSWQKKVLDFQALHRMFQLHLIFLYFFLT